MRFIASRTGDNILVRAVRNNYKVKPGEAEVGSAPWLAPISNKVGDSVGFKRGHHLFAKYDLLVPEFRAELSVIKARGTLLARQIKDAIVATAIELKKKGLTHPNVEALLKYEVLNQLDSERKIREIEHVRHEGIRA